MALAAMAPLARVEGWSFVPLQPGPPGEGMPLRDPGGSIEDFADTAALIDNLDLVISVDTAVAHLAGAMGRPVWLLNRFDTDWRWFLDRDDSPWYGSMRVFRQTVPGDWSAVVEKAATALRDFAAA